MLKVIFWEVIVIGEVDPLIVGEIRLWTGVMETVIGEVILIMVILYGELFSNYP